MVKKKGQKHKIVKIWLFYNMKEKDAAASNRRKHCSSGSYEGPDRCQRSPLRYKDKIKYVRFAAVVPLLLGCLCTARCFWNSEEVWVGIVQIVSRVAHTQTCTRTDGPFVAATRGIP